MDTLREFDVANDADDFDYAESASVEAPVLVLADERRMQVRAYTMWASLLGDGPLPSIQDLSPEQMEEYGAHGVLLDISAGLDDPAIRYMGSALRAECDIDGSIDRISQVPPRTLLSRLTDHYLQIIANATPIGFEAEFVNQRGAEILYRGILMPFTAQKDSIDFLFGVINWKEAAGDDLAAAIHREMAAAPAFDLPSFAPAQEPAQDETGEEDAPADWLAHARDGADQARSSAARSQAQLYRAIGLAYDFALATRARPDDYAELLADAGIRAQPRNPMAALAKLVFGADQDGARLTEIARALTLALKAEVPVGGFNDYLAAYADGLKGLLCAHRTRSSSNRSARRDTARRSLRAAPPIEAEAVPTDADGLAVVIARREENGGLAIVAALPEGSQLGQRVIVAAKR